MGIVSFNLSTDLLITNVIVVLQLLFNALWNLPTEKVQEALCIKLPPPSHQLPREKPVPKPKPLTKWEAYAKSKGIDRKSNKSKGGEEGKAGRLVWDDQVKEWLPKFGYKKAQAEQKKNWMMEIKVRYDELWNRIRITPLLKNSPPICVISICCHLCILISG